MGGGSAFGEALVDGAHRKMAKCRSAAYELINNEQSVQATKKSLVTYLAIRYVVATKK